jgi:hypothetical protein
MSDQHNETVQSTQIAEELRQRILEQLDTSKKEIEELSEEQLEAAAGGFGLGSLKTILKWGMIGADAGTVGGALTGSHGPKLP